ncbi:MAG: hypothetical protein KAJ51_17410, partial [Thermoplasmata archaeon]|nr:hypothetical protein [Thermoplasmata archaeon]
FPHSKEVDPGETVTYSILVTNRANGEYFIIISPYTLKTEWGDAIFGFEGKEYLNRFETTLKYCENITVTLKLKIPKSELVGSYETVLNITDKRWTTLCTFETKVNQTYDLSLSVFNEGASSYTRSLVESISPGWERSYVFKVENHGNGPETVELQINGLDRINITGRQGYFHAVAKTRIYTTNVETQNFTEIIDASTLPKDLVLVNNGNTEVDIIRLKLNAGQKAYISIKLTAPRFSNDNIEENTIGVTVTSAKPALENQIDNEVELVFKFLLPDLVIDRINHPKYIVDGDVIAISTFLKNLGDIEAKNINVALFVDDKYVRSVNIIRIQNGTDDLFVTFCWQAISGKHEIKIVIDQYNNIPEQNDQFQEINNNVITKTLTIAGERRRKNIELNRFLIDIGLIIAIAILAILIILKTRKYSRKKD